MRQNEKTTDERSPIFKPKWQAMIVCFAYVAAMTAIYWSSIFYIPDRFIWRITCVLNADRLNSRSRPRLTGPLMAINGATMARVSRFYNQGKSPLTPLCRLFIGKESVIPVQKQSGILNNLRMKYLFLLVWGILVSLLMRLITNGNGVLHKADFLLREPYIF